MFKNIGSNWIVSFFTLGVAYIITPFLIKSLGIEGYGIWTLMTSITGYLSLLVIGVPLTSVRYFTKYISEKNYIKLNEIIVSCAGIYILIGIISIIIGAGMFVFFKVSYDIPPKWQSDAFLGFFVLIFCISIGFVGILPEGIMLAHQDFIIRNLIRLTIIFIRFGLIIILLTYFHSIFILACIQIICTIMEFIISYCIIKKRYEAIKISFKYFKWTIVKEIFSFSLYVLLLNMGVHLSFYTDSLVIGAFLNLNKIPYYSVANNLFIYLLELIIAIAAVVLPTSTKLYTNGDLTNLRVIFLKWSKISFSLTILIGIFLIILGPRFIGWWIDPTFEDEGGKVLQILMVSSLIFMPIRGVAQPILIGMGKVKLPAIAFLSAGVLNLFISLALVKPWGLNGVAIGTVIPIGLFSFMMLIYACRELKIYYLFYIKYAFLKPIIGSFGLIFLLIYFRVFFEIKNFAGLAVAGISTVFIFILIWVLFVYKNDPYIKLGKQLLIKLLRGRI